MSKIDDFLKKYLQHPDDIDYEETLNAFIEDMDKGLNGEESTLMMIPTYLSVSDYIQRGKKVLAIDAGGTNLRLGLVSFSEEGYELSRFYKQKMLGVGEPLDKEQFLDRLSDLILPYLDETDSVGFCFSFPSEITPDKDGIVLSFAKEVYISGCEGMHIGAELSRVLHEKGVEKPVYFYLLNDTVATLLGGPIIENTDGQIGFILGTGTNTAYLEKTENIRKIENDSENMIINMESGMFGRVKQGYFDQLVDSKSAKPNDHLFEKMISGVYLGKVIRETLIQAFYEELFNTNSRILQLPEFDMAAVSIYLDDRHGNNLLAEACYDESDHQSMDEIIDRALERAAKLVSINLLAIILKTGGGKKAPIQIVVEGSTFHKCLPLQNKIIAYLQKEAVEKYGRQYRFDQGEDVNMLGSAKAVLCNK